MIQERVRFYNNKQRRIEGRIYKDDPVSEDGVIFCHGLFSSKDGYKITGLAGDIVRCGYTLLTFDFSFSGESEGVLSDLSLLQEVEDLKSAHTFFSEYGIKRMHLIGSSMGGAVCILFASASSAVIESIILIATPVKLDKLIFDMTGIDDIDSIPDAGMTLIDNIPINNLFFKESKLIDMKSAVSKIKAPVLVIHGGLDKVVDPDNAEFLQAELGTRCSYILIGDGDHNLVRDADMKILRNNITRWLADLRLKDIII